MIACYGECLVQLPVELLQNTLSVHHTYIRLKCRVFFRYHSLTSTVLACTSVSLLVLAITRFIKNNYKLSCTGKYDIQCILNYIIINGTF